MAEVQENQVLSARELLEQVFARLATGGQEIKLPSPACAEIANDSDHHRTRVGCTVYESATITVIGGRTFILAFGRKDGGYPAARYNCDIAAIDISSDISNKSAEELAQIVFKKLEKNYYFRDSVIYALGNGNLAIPTESRQPSRSKKLLARLQLRLPEYVAKELEIDHGYCYLDLSPVVKMPFLYKPEGVDFLVQQISEVLAE